VDDGFDEKDDSADDIIEPQPEIDGEPAASPEEIAVAAERYEKVTGEEFPRGAQFPHAGNIAKKLKDHRDKGTDLSRAIDEILKQYMEWRKATFTATGDKSALISAKVTAFDQYASFLDTPGVDVFDSRGALVSSALEEFCFYLLKPVLDGFPQALLGKQDTYQGLYFTARSFAEFLRLPSARTPVNTLDFIIGTNVQGAVTKGDASEEFPISLPAVAVECKAYLDRPRFIESQIMAGRIKAAFPQCLYILVAQTLKLDLKKIGVAPEIDGIYVWRRMQNIDRMTRRKNGTPMKPLHVPAIEHFYDRVEKHLTVDWLLADPFESGILK